MIEYSVLLHFCSLCFYFPSHVDKEGTFIGCLRAPILVKKTKCDLMYGTTYKSTPERIQGHLEFLEKLLNYNKQHFLLAEEKAKRLFMG